MAKQVTKKSKDSCIINAAVYQGNERLCSVNLDEAGEWAKKPDHIVWIGLYEPDEKILKKLQKQFNLNPLAIEDANQTHQRTKVEQYGDSLFIVARTLESQGKYIALHETHIFVGKGYVVTVRHGGSASYGPVRLRYESLVHPFKDNEQFITYSLLDFIVDNYIPVVERIHHDVEQLEDRITKGPFEAEDVEELHRLQRNLLRLRTAVAPMVEVCKRLEHGDLLPVPPDIQELFRDVTDHIRRVQDEIEVLREVLVFAFNTNMMLGQVAQGDITRKLAAWAAILAVPTAIAGIYGMNFQFMPETQWQYGYFAILAVMFTICTTLYLLFRKNDWL
ncbi:magnesium/cobalt transporter CorA [Microvirga sp. W0021]|uniref:Magnesium transport protein CorA n=1 Tax=Hohaiivirga grylli TaxID=3133970 RepID=A0ABV0BJH7_9HYPH